MTIAFALTIVGCAGAVLMGVSQVGKGIVSGIDAYKKRKAEDKEDKED